MRNLTIKIRNAVLTAIGVYVALAEDYGLVSSILHALVVLGLCLWLL